MQFQVLVNIYSVQRQSFISGSHIGRVATFGSRDRVDQGSNPDGFVCLIPIFTFPSGMDERSFCSKFAPFEGYMCDCHWRAKSPLSASLSLLCIKMF